MLRMIGRRLVLLVLQVVFATGAFTVAFFYLSPNAPGQELLPQHASAHQAAAFDAASPLHKYWDILTMWLSGNLGYTPDNGYVEPLSTFLAHALPYTITLVVASTVIGLLIGAPLGVARAFLHGSLFDRTAGVAAVVMSAAPSFLVGQWLIDAFTIGTSIPAEGPQTYGFAAIFTDWRGMLLPIASVSIAFIGRTSQVAKSITLDQLVSEYVRVAQAYGASRWRLLRRHLARNIAAPLITYLGLAFPFLLGAVVAVEALFNIRGLGFDLVDGSGAAFDPGSGHQYLFDIELTVVLVSAVLMLVTQMVTDVISAFLDPRLPRR